MTEPEGSAAPLLVMLDAPAPPLPRPAPPPPARPLRRLGLGLCVAAGLGAGVGLRLHTHPRPELWAAPLLAVRAAQAGAEQALWDTVETLSAIGEPAPMAGSIPDQIDALADSAWALLEASQTLLWTVLHPATLLAVEPGSLGVGNGLSTSPIGRGPGSTPPPRPGARPAAPASTIPP